MKTIYLIFPIMVAILVLHAFAADTNMISSDPITNNIRILITSTNDGHAYRFDQPVKILIRLVNISTQYTIWFWEFEENWAEDFRDNFVVISPSGNTLIPKTKRGVPESGDMKRLDPKETNEYEFNLSRLFRFNEEGAYVIIVRKTVWLTSGRNEQDQKMKRFQVVSNPLKVNVLPK